ncbi:hypothetical protein D3C87_1238260 [compost metagenome]
MEASALLLAVTGGVLGDQDELLDAALGQHLGFLDDGVHRAGRVAAAQLRNDAEGAGVIAAFRDLEVGGRADGGQEARQDHRNRRLGFVLDHREAFALLDASHDVDDLVELGGTDHGVDFRKLREQVALVPLDEAAGDDQLLVEGAQVENGTDGFPLGLVDEGAGVHQEDVGLRFIGDEVIAGLREQAQHVFGVDGVLGAAEADDSNLGGHEIPF